ncbi:DUF2510 domain-containing protein [Gordonia aurantiaca]|uniref:DUF2510 domain-containing protein n=1 Tax=Gordonia sp. B21 TaxID=3151852 RepID=UPI003266AC66
MTTPPTPPSGWYPDPHGGAGSRYWDGRKWSAMAAPAPAPPSSAYGGPAQPRPEPGKQIVAKPPRTVISLRDWRTVVVLLIVGAIAVTGAVVMYEQPPDEDAYFAEVFPSKFESMWLQEERYVEQGYAACDLLRDGHSEQDVARYLGEQYSDKYEAEVPRSVREQHQRQIAAARKHLCPGV